MLRYFLFCLLALIQFSVAAQKPATAAAPPTGPKVRLVLAQGDTSLMGPLKAALQGHVQLDSTAPVALMARFSDAKASPVAGEQAMMNIRMDLQLEAIHLPSGKPASDRTIVLEGKGPNQGLARRVAMRRLNSTHVDMINWGRQFANEYAVFFRNNCDTLMTQARKHAAAAEYLPAFALVAGIPENVSCTKDAATLKGEYYLAYQKNQCTTHLQQARTALAAGQLASALQDLSLVDPEAICASDAAALLDSIALKMPDQLPTQVAAQRQTLQQKAKWEAARKQIRYALLERHIMAIKED